MLFSSFKFCRISYLRYLKSSKNLACDGSCNSTKTDMHTKFAGVLDGGNYTKLIFQGSGRGSLEDGTRLNLSARSGCFSNESC